jgi:hypothetical protein
MEISRKIFERTAPVLASYLVKDASVYENQTKPDSNLAAVCGGAASGHQRSATRDQEQEREGAGQRGFQSLQTSSTTSKTTAKT